MKESSDTSWQSIYKQFHKNILGRYALYLLIVFAIFGIYAPFFASSKPIIIKYDGIWYFPLFRYLFFSGFFTKRLDIFFNLLMFTLPAGFIFYKIFRKNRLLTTLGLIAIAILQFGLFLYFAFFGIPDPASDATLAKAKQKKTEQQLKKRSTDVLVPPRPIHDWYFELEYMNDYAKLNQVLRYQQRLNQHRRISKYAEAFFKERGKSLPTLWQMEIERINEQVRSLQQRLESKEADYLAAFNTLDLYLEACQSLNAVNSKPNNCYKIKQATPEESEELRKAKQTIFSYWSLEENERYFKQKQLWLEGQMPKITFEMMPLLRPFHWEDDAGGDQTLNRRLPWWERTRIGRKDLVAALIFGIRISLVVGFLAVALAVIIGVPIGAFAGYYGGTFDIIVSRLLEIWESMPTFFMLLLVISMAQSKSIFIIIAVIGLFGWPAFSRYTRGEFFKQRNLSYVEALKGLGFSNRSIMFREILPNAIPPLLTLLPFAIMAAITSEAGLSFLGLGEESSGSWGVLMDEGRTAFPAEAYLLWPPAILLTILLVAIALVGDSLRDALDPKLKS